MLRLVAITARLVRELEHPGAFETRTGLRVGELARLVLDVARRTERLRAATGAPPRWGGFLAVDAERSLLVGTCTFKAAPAAGVVEIAYFTFRPFEGQGWATAMADALVERAQESGEVRVVRAHTLPTPGASTTVLERLGFTRRGTVDDPDDGPVWRWELRVPAGPSGALDARIPEPELMDDAAQALAYARADFEEPHARFVAELGARLPDLLTDGRALDLGCGPGDVTLRVLRARPGWQIDAVDGSPAMLALARVAAAGADPGGRVRFVEGVLPDLRLRQGAYDLVMSNSLLHHLHRPAVLWECVRRCARPGAAVFVMDLLRPADVATADALVARWVGDEREILRRDFRASLLAAFRPDEVRAQLAAAGLGRLAVDVVSDRHLLVWGRLAPGHG